jgi:hypothetical protein
MDWTNLLGKALNKPKKKILNLNKLEYRILYIVNKEFEEFIEDIKINNNKFGKWVIL